MVVLPAHRASFNANSRSEEFPIKYPNALVVYDDEQLRFPLEPEGPKIEDVQPETAIVLYDPPKEPEGNTVSAVVSFNFPTENKEAPRKKSKKNHYDGYEDDMNDYPPYIELRRSFASIKTKNKRRGFIYITNYLL